MTPNATQISEIDRILKAEKRRQKRRKFLVRLVSNYIITALSALLNGWMFMLAIGVIHAEWLRQLPTIGYWWAVLVVYLLSGVFSRVTYPKGDDAK